MSFYNPEIPLKEKVVSHHPWEKYIKDAYRSTYKYGHNSANNTIIYPPEKVKVPNTDRMKFTVIGNRLTKEFIYSTNLVKGLYKYRWKNFNEPVIRGVTSVEWPKVWNDLKIQFGGLAYCLKSQVAILVNDQFLGGEKELKELIESKYTYHIRPDYYGEAIKQFSSYIKSSGRPCAYMHISDGDFHIGTLIFMLYADIVPRTCENFLRLCKTNKGGYAGTPIHRIVKDCWIQCGGFGLKDTKLDCENFIVPHDRRGVIAMANAGRHIDCSTQFFVLLQPAEWMAHKYVAFGQLIDGEETLKKIEQVPTWYESPTRRLTIFRAGILNLECQGIMINRGSNKYIAGHIENLFELGEIFYEMLLEKVFLEVDFRCLQRLREEMVGEGVEIAPEEGTKNLHATERFMRKKGEIVKHIERSQSERSERVSPNPEKVENNDFDVEEYQYEPEEYSYKHVSIVASTSVDVKPDKPFYIPLTDVPYPGEVDSTFNLRKLLKGDYCLESDLDQQAGKKKKADERFAFPSELYIELFEKKQSQSDLKTADSLDSDDEILIQKYLNANADRTSFAGDVIRAIAKGADFNILEHRKGTGFITDETLRKFNIVAEEYRGQDKTTIEAQLNIKAEMQKLKEVKRRQTGFIRPEDLDRMRQFQVEDEEDDDEDDEDEEDDDICGVGPCGPRPQTSDHNVPGVGEVEQSETASVHLGDVGNGNVFPKTSSEMLLALEGDESPNARKHPYSSTKDTDQHPIQTQPITFNENYKLDMDDDDYYDDYLDNYEKRPSVLARLFDDVGGDDDDTIGEAPTLKDYVPYSEMRKNNALFLTSTGLRFVDDANSRERFKRRSLSMEKHEKSIDQVLFLQHGKNVYRKISSDYVKTINNIEHKVENSIRSIEYAKMRPAISIKDYQKKNRQYHKNLKKLKQNTDFVDDNDESQTSVLKNYGLELPGDNQLYQSLTEITSGRPTE